MNREFTPATFESVLGKTYITDYRTPLHVPFSAMSNCEEARVLSLSNAKEDPAIFNAIGSAIMHSNKSKHLPVLDVDGGVQVQREGRKAVLGAAYEGNYSPVNLLRDVLGDHGIDLEVSSYPEFVRWKMFDSYELKGMRVGMIALRSSKEIFESVESTTPGHGHLYINEAFSASDHHELIKGLGSVGIVSPAWQKLTDLEEMSIVRTPWTEKAINARPS